MVWGGGPPALQAFNKFLLEGYTRGMEPGARACILHNNTVGTKCNHVEVASVRSRKAVGKRYGAGTFPALAKVVVRLLCVHPTSTSTERNGALWGPVFVASRNAQDLAPLKSCSCSVSTLEHSMLAWMILHCALMWSGMRWLLTRKLTCELFRTICDGFCER